MKTEEELKGLPHVPISTFKANPAHYLETGALITTHGHVRAAFVPMDEPDELPGLDSVKAQLKLLSRMRQPDHVAEELRDLRRTRDSEDVGEPR
ncbi:hypothetical protein P5G50_15585 [Leifsonia sp. F6_8S_P_1B]|uniref:Prevent-host-death family protein n=1 Tax=Leifsonia williamsii TaxID=3035919 RepID=A0ABT8KHC6_9MICO|nr:hypothetical protein [Leifsonia williamsii]MDN4615872.1 hypothetical protein [Leifsonia williamsii]